MPRWKPCQRAHKSWVYLPPFPINSLFPQTDDRQDSDNTDSLASSLSRQIRNDDIRKKIGKQSSIIDVIKKRKLELFGHICRMRDDRLIRTVMMGMVTGNRRRGRPPKRWIDDIVNWCSCSLADAIRRAEDRKQWRDKIYHVTGLYGPSGT